MKKFALSLLFILAPIGAYAAKPTAGTALNTGSTLYPNLNNAWGFLEGSGSTVTDSMSHSTGSIHTGINWTTDADGPLLTAPSGTGYISLTSSVTTTYTGGGWSIAWRSQQLNADNQGMILGDNTGTNRFIWFTSGAMTVRAPCGSDLTSGTLSTLTSTHDYVLAEDGSTLNLFQDGTLVWTKNPSISCISFNTLFSGYSGQSFCFLGKMSYIYVWKGVALSTANAVSLHASPYQIFNSAVSESFTVSQGTIPANHNGNININLTGTGSAWASTTTFLVSGVSGISLATATVTNSTQAVISLTVPSTLYTTSPGNTGTLSITDSLSTTTLVVQTPSLSISPTNAVFNSSNTLTMTGANTIWGVEYSTGLFSASGGTGVVFSTNPTVQTNLISSATLFTGTVSGSTITIKDLSTGATANFLVTAAPVESFTVNLGTIPANHNGNISINLTAVNSAWASSTIFLVSGVSGVTLSTRTVLNSTQCVVSLALPSTLYTTAPGNTGTLSITDSISTATLMVQTPSITISPVLGAVSSSYTLTTTGINTIWTTEYSTGLFSTSGGTGVAFSTNPYVQNDFISTATLYTGSVSGSTITIKDLSTGATSNFLISASVVVTTYDLTLSTVQGVFIQVEGGPIKASYAGKTSWGLAWNDGSVYFKGAMTELDVYCYNNGAPLNLIQDGVFLSSITIPNTSAWAWVTINAAMDGNAHTYILTWGQNMFVQQIRTTGATAGINTAFLPARPGIAFFGDSITAGDNYGTNSNTSFVHLVGLYFNSQTFNRGVHSSLVSGVGGGATRTADITANIPGPVTVVNLYGTNDVASVSTTTFAAAYTTMVELEQDALPGSLILNERLLKAEVGETIRDPFSTAIQNVVSTLNFAKDVYVQGAHNAYDGSSGVHPNTAQLPAIAVAIEADITANTSSGGAAVTRVMTFVQ
jgi:lysophospholipase L1-like esterase